MTYPLQLFAAGNTLSDACPVFGSHLTFYRRKDWPHGLGYLISSAIHDIHCLLGCFCLVAVGILVKDRANLRIELSHYRRFLFIPWKLLVFIPAFLFVTFAGRFTDDETWDVMSGGGMSLLTFLTAPWVLGLFYQTLKGWRPKRYMVVAFALCLFSSSWFYDIYLLWRDGEYTSRWFGNLLLSPTIYVAAGLLWNLEVGPNE